MTFPSIHGKTVSFCPSLRESSHQKRFKHRRRLQHNQIPPIRLTIQRCIPLGGFPTQLEGGDFLLVASAEHWRATVDVKYFNRRNEPILNASPQHIAFSIAMGEAGTKNYGVYIYHEDRGLIVMEFWKDFEMPADAQAVTLQRRKFTPVVFFVVMWNCDKCTWEKQRVMVSTMLREANRLMTVLELQDIE
ncbi:hypothetical protein BT69DRAFT_1292584 [Atractiella rhizophila]|nr:hypothetical protein BT69DRAFT_1292584 [Atractiella rhizophila]